MENTSNPTPNTNDSPKPNPNLNSIDGFSRPMTTPPPATDTATNSSSPNEQQAVQDTTPPANDTGNKDDSASQPALSVPTTSSGIDQKRSKIWTIVLVVLILIVFVGGIYGVYAYQQNKIKKLNTQVTSLTSQTSALNTEISNLKNSPSASINTSSSSTQTIFKVPELGMSLTVPAALADLTYVTNSAKDTANLSTTNLSTLDSTCTASASTAPLGSLSKTNGQYPTSSSATTTLVKQFSTYYISYTKPSSACSNVTQINTLVNSLTTDLKGTFSTIQSITS